ncbi:MAG: PAS domain-containing protein [Alphaproteobacteria bacterium]|nr:PAS domain-containing protein [Alphaproteobacteria bacterium]
MVSSTNSRGLATAASSQATAVKSRTEFESRDTELAGDLAAGKVTVSDYYVMRDETLQTYLDELPPDAALRRAHAYWQNLNERGSLPARRDIDPTEVGGETLPHIVLIDVEEEPIRRFRYRLVGTSVAKIFGADYTGKYLDEMGLGKVFDRVKALYSLICAEPSPALLTGTYIAKSGAAFQVTRMAMPLSSDGKSVDTLFCVVDRT